MNPDLEKRVPLKAEILAELIEEGTEAFRGILEKLFNVAMQLERSEFLGAEAYERTASRRGYRNGFKGKRIQTRVGELHLEIPQVRGLRFYPKSLERGCRSEKALKLAIAEMYVMGVSTRKVTEITEQLCGLEISATQVSRVAGMLDEELEEFRSRELGEYPIVYLDAHYEKVRRGGRVQDVAILKAIGVNRFGTREVLGLSARISEAEVHWRGFLGDLHKRGNHPTRPVPTGRLIFEISKPSRRVFWVGAPQVGSAGVRSFLEAPGWKPDGIQKALLLQVFINLWLGEGGMHPAKYWTTVFLSYRATIGSMQLLPTVRTVHVAGLEAWNLRNLRTG